MKYITLGIVILLAFPFFISQKPLPVDVPAVEISDSTISLFNEVQHRRIVSFENDGRTYHLQFDSTNELYTLIDVELLLDGNRNAVQWTELLQEAQKRVDEL